MDWDSYFMGFATQAAKKSKDSTKVGAVLVSPEGAVILTGFNGPPKGVLDLPERFVRPEKYLYAAHAERNLISFAAREGIRTKGCKVYCTHVCCSTCAQTMLQAGVVEVVYGPGTFQNMDKEKEAAENMFREVGAVLRNFECTEV